MEENIKRKILDELKTDIDIYSKEKIKEINIDKVLLETKDLKIDAKEKNYLIKELYDDICGYGIIERFLKDP